MQKRKDSDVVGVEREKSGGMKPGIQKKKSYGVGEKESDWVEGDRRK